MLFVTLREAKADLSELIEESMDGEEVVIANGTKPLVKLVPISSTSSERRQSRIPKAADQDDAVLGDG